MASLRTAAAPVAARSSAFRSGVLTLSAIGIAVALGAAVLGAAVLGAGPAAAQATCDWYANTALQQQKLNVDRKCGFKGESWSFDRRQHMAWCQDVGPDQWKKQAQFRDQELVKCAAGTRR